jgi:endonuclease G
VGFGAIPKDNRQRSSCSAKTILQNCFTATKPVQNDCFFNTYKSSEQPLFNYVVSVDLIEQKTGIDFFPALEDSIEDELESRQSDLLGLLDSF